MTTQDSATFGAGAPTPPPDASVPPGKSPLARGLMVALAVLVIAAVAAIAITVIGGGTAEAQVTLRTLGSSGDSPFGPSIAEPPSANLTDFAQNGARGGSDLTSSALEGSRATPISGTSNLSDYRTVSGNVPGVFGGTLDERTCNVDTLVRFLESDVEKARAWSSVLGMDTANIARYTDTLTAANLAADTRVLEHGFADGQLVPRETVLQRGSAVLVDARGVPRVDCYSGNPLRNPMIQANETFVGTPWPSFTESTVVVVEPAATDITEFVLVDVADGSEFVRPTGSTGESDIAASSSSGSDGDTENAAPTGPSPTATPAPITRDLNMMGVIEVNRPISSDISRDVTELIFEFDAAPGAMLQLAVTNDRASVGTIAVELRRAGTSLDFFRVPAGGSDSVDLTLDHESGGRYEVVITEGPAAFEFVIGSQIQDDAGQGRDAGADFADALQIASGSQVVGHLAGLDKADAYVLELQDAPALIMTARADRNSGRPAFQLESLGESIEFFRVNPADENTYELLLGPDDDGLLEVYVTEGPANYEFVVELVPQDDAASGGDAPAELADALQVDSADEIAGEVGQRDEGDFYLFTAPSDDFTLFVDVAPDADSRVAIDVLDPDGIRVDFFRVEPGATGSVTVNEPDTAGQTYRLIFTEGRGTYSVSFDDSVPDDS